MAYSLNSYFKDKMKELEKNELEVSQLNLNFLIPR